MSSDKDLAPLTVSLNETDFNTVMHSPEFVEAQKKERTATERYLGRIRRLQLSLTKVKGARRFKVITQLQTLNAMPPMGKKL